MKGKISPLKSGSNPTPDIFYGFYQKSIGNLNKPATKSFYPEKKRGR